MRGGLLVLIILLSSQAGCLAADNTDDGQPLPASLPDPTAGGALDWTRHTFVLEPRLVSGDGTVSPYPVEPEGSVHVPAGAGPYPIVVFMHGRHGTCQVMGGEFLGTPCPDVNPVLGPVPNHEGYDHMAEDLASHGYVVLSLSANHVNDRDNDYGLAGAAGPIAGQPRVVGDDYGATARGRLLLGLLDDLRDVQAGGGPEPLQFLTGVLDLDRIGLMGHSRGGEGVARAAVLNGERTAGDAHAIRAVFALAPTDFARHIVTGVAFGTLLPYCDGDVSNLQGAWMVDDARTNPEAGPLHQFLALGANHNWYNTVWTYSDWTSRGDPHCDLNDPSSGRDTSEQQQAHGLAIMNGFLRAYVGNETDLMPFLTGAAPWPQPGIHSSYLAPANQHIVLDAGNGAGRFDSFTSTQNCSGIQCPIPRTYARAEQIHVEWQQAATWTLEGQWDVRAMDTVSLRIGFDHRLDAVHPVVIHLRDGSGATTGAELQGGVFLPPGDGGAKTTLNTAWAPLDAFTGLDLGDIREVRVEFLGSGAAQVTDLRFQAWP